MSAPLLCPECGEAIEPGDLMTLDPQWHGELRVHVECGPVSAHVRAEIIWVESWDAWASGRR